MTTAAIPIFALNDWAVKAKLKTVNQSTGAVTPVTSGTVTAFLATSSAAGATAADPSLSMAPVHIGDGVWLVSFDAAVLTATLLDSLFGSTPPYLIVQQVGAVRAYALCSYSAVRPALVG